ncbi:MAG: hypothetical protein AABX89_07310 [Candidatus Thermoplasmatota archaeon]
MDSKRVFLTLIGVLLLVGGLVTWRLNFEDIKYGGACTIASTTPDGTFTCTKVAPQASVSQIVTAVVEALVATTGAAMIAWFGVTTRRPARTVFLTAAACQVGFLVAASLLQENFNPEWTPSVLQYIVYSLVAAIAIVACGFAWHRLKAPNAVGTS